MNELKKQHADTWTQARQHIGDKMTGVENAPALLEYTRAFQIACEQETAAVSLYINTAAPDSEVPKSSAPKASSKKEKPVEPVPSPTPDETKSAP
ncbi:hypothetical protein EON83_00105 [bacterium]|nr:MAG: hypothetical protein EON83_00105 [bacterium]